MFLMKIPQQEKNLQLKLQLKLISFRFSFSRFRVHRLVGNRRYRFCVRLGSNICHNISRKMVAGRRNWTSKYLACRVYVTKWICWITVRRWVDDIVCRSARQKQKRNSFQTKDNKLWQEAFGFIHDLHLCYRTNFSHNSISNNEHTIELWALLDK